MSKQSGRKKGFLRTVASPFVTIGHIFIKGDWITRLSFLIMGFGNLCRGQILKGIGFLLCQAATVWYFIGFGWQYLSKIGTLGTTSQGKVWDEAAQIFRRTMGDNSMLILLYSVMSIFLLLFFLGLYFTSLKSAFHAQELKAMQKPLPTVRQDLRTLSNSRFHTTLLTLPTLMVVAFTVLPIVFMILMAFTNFDKSHQPPGNLFTWVGTQNFKDIFWQSSIKSYTFSQLLTWTLIWAFFATFTNYLFGMILAIMINKKGIRLKSMWRTIFVITIAVPQFVSLLLMSQLLHDQGPVNVLLKQMGWIKESIPFLTDGNIARVVVIIVNMWVGIPYTMLITTGILMNIPQDLYEAAEIDGAGPVKAFFKITLPYMLFVTTPYLITQFVGNLNNFNVIYLLTKGDPKSVEFFQAGKTDLLVTWLYKLTVNNQEYALASTIGILVFVISAGLSLVVYNMSGSARKEEEFQ
ncbi:MAG: sugar ABC transporter permease [Clostridia bacterium]